MNFSTTYRNVNLHYFFAFLGQPTLTYAPIEPTLDIVVRRLDANGLILLLVEVILLLHDDNFGWPFPLEDLRKSAQWIPVRLIAVELAQTFVCVLALTTQVSDLSKQSI